MMKVWHYQLMSQPTMNNNLQKPLYTLNFYTLAAFLAHWLPDY